MTFKDYFSGHAKVYAAARPTYPDSLFQYLMTKTPNRELAWDCATGNGQTAQALADYFDKIVATDGSEAQLAAALENPKISYQVAMAEKAPFADESVSLITVSQALHWFNTDLFFAEVERVLMPEGCLAVWSYGIHTVSPDIDELIDDLYNNTLNAYWTPERKMVEEGYSSLNFPLSKIQTPSFKLQAHWSREQMLAYFDSWSAVQKFKEARGLDPVAAIAPQLAQLWPDNDTKAVTWPLSVFLRQKLE